MFLTSVAGTISPLGSITWNINWLQNEETELVPISLPLKHFPHHVVGAVAVVAGAQLCGRDGQSWPDPECGHKGDLHNSNNSNVG